MARAWAVYDTVCRITAAFAHATKLIIHDSRACTDYCLQKNRVTTQGPCGPRCTPHPRPPHPPSHAPLTQAVYNYTSTHTDYCLLTHTVDRHGSPARPTNFHSHTSSSWPNGPFAPSRGCCAVPRSAPALPRDAVHCQRARGSSPRTSQSLRPTLQTSARVLVVRIACERLERGGGQWPVERGTPRSRSELGSAVGKTSSAAQRQRGIEPPAAAARAALNRRFAVGEPREPLFTSRPPLLWGPVSGSHRCLSP